MPKFSVHLDYLFQERPLLQRIDAAAAAGFKAVEGRFPDVPAADYKRALERNNIRALGINTPAGGEGEFGFCAVPGREADWDKSFAQALDYVITIGASAIHCLAGKVDPGQRAEAEKVYVANLQRAADLAAAKNIKLYLEPINPRDQPGYFLYQVEHAADIIAKIGKPNVWMQYDFYHVQIVGGDLIRRLEKYFAIIGHIQCSQVPVRGEPDEHGEINYPFVFSEVDRLGYKEWIGCEYRPRGRTESGLGWGAEYGLVASS
jgi:hydroxypyruvate isomerase